MSLLLSSPLSLFSQKSSVTLTLISKPSALNFTAPGPYTSTDFKSLCRLKCSATSLGGEEAPSTRIFIKGLSQSTSEGSLVKIFSRSGEVVRVKVLTDRRSKQSLGLAYVWFNREEEARLAVKEIDGKFVDGRFVLVTIARLESPTSQVRSIPYRF